MNTLKCLLIIILFSFGAAAQEIDLANEYFKKGEFEKAVEYYKKISKSAKEKESSRLIHDNYIVALTKLKDFEEAEKFLKKQIKAYPNSVNYKADYAYLLENFNKKEEAEKEFKTIIEEASKTDAYVYELQNYFYKIKKYEYVVDILLKNREKSKQVSKNDIQLARAYMLVGQKELMLEEVISYGLNNKNIAYVQATIQDNIKEDDEKEILQKLLYSKIQSFPNETYYSELLGWFFVQQKEYNKAFIQIKSIDKKIILDGSKVFELAGLAFQNKEFKAASKMYQYIMEEYPKGDFYPYARRWNIQCKEELIKTSYPINIDNIKELISDYELMLTDLGNSPKTIEALRNMALLNAFYLDNHQKAIDILTQAISLSGSNQKFKDQCKLDMGDIYILKNESWESTLLYMQVEKTQKEDILGEQAKLKNAKLYYYKGEFELAKEILDILKKATTREIANDAMDLSLLIQDNTGLDSSETAMMEYAAIDLLVYQNKNDQALKSLDNMLAKYKTHNLADEILWLKSSIYQKIDKIDDAIASLKQIIENYKSEILADDALFTLAKIYDKTKEDKKLAMDLYKKTLQDFPGSIYAAEARKRYRELRGDFMN